jgi:photosystem II stability/assembly factor-like uncharacterized protein
MNRNSKRLVTFLVVLSALFAGGCKKDSPTDGGNTNSIQFEGYGAPSGISASRVVSNKNGDLFIPAGWSGLFRYRQSNMNWEWLDVTHSGGYVSDVCITPNGNIVCGVAENGLYYSTDNGDNWSIAIKRVTYKSIRFYVGNIFEIWFISEEDEPGKLTAWRSEDNGKSWAQRNTPTGNKETSAALAFNSADHVYFANADGIYKSLDSGRSYKLMASVPSISHLYINSSGGTYMFTPSTAGKFSADSGRSPVDAQLPLNVTDVVDGSDGNVYASTHNPAPASDGGVWKSTDKGATWSEVKHFSRPLNGVTEHSGQIYVSSEGFGVLTSTDNITWNSIGPRGVNTIYSIAFNHDQSLLAASYGAYRTNDGQNWNDLPGPSALLYTISASNKGHILQGGDNVISLTAESGIGGQTATISGTARASAFFPNANPLVGTSAGFIVTADNGKTWTALPGVDPGADVHSIAIDSANLVYAGLKLGGAGTFWRSTDSARTFVVKNKGIENLVIVAIAVNSKRHIYVSDGTKIYVSKDSAETWSAYDINGKDSDDKVNAMAFDTSDKLYIGTNKTILRSKDPQD